ncbi:uncharacterized protein F4822DRAFT_430717 [Hypoxylon trugodes]|uniref:uncharacterized protein n=1 Tax=Hypoxylon trugodes TaxID=326681 RepID=UPI00219C8D9C|nr:uncharacterized protein F4822DRAFT_430717 [Hypoxylon trugodes]KAI1387967.1 hypothetical protein F4822DRAFT_430717 [Hypoxylon trugodes]
MLSIKILQLLVLGAHVALAQIYDNGPFQLHVSSLNDSTINGRAYPCQTTLGLCYTAGDASSQSTDGGFIFTSRGRADYTVGYLSWRRTSNIKHKNGNGNKQTSSTVSSYGPVGLIYDPGSNVAVPVLNQTGTPGTLGFDGSTGDLVMAGIDDTVMNGGSTTTTTTTAGNKNGTSTTSNGSKTSGNTTTTQNRNYNNWYLCLVQLETDQQAQMLVSWVLGANLGWPPTNPTCQRINITMDMGAVGYGGLSVFRK